MRRSPNSNEHSLRLEVAGADLSSTGGKDGGFTLIEVVVALIVILIALLGVFFSITYAINYNAGNSSRAKTLAVLQQEVERLRSAKFTPTFTDVTLYGASTSQTVTVNNLSFVVNTVIDNDPATTDIDLEADIPSAETRIKGVTVTATLANPSPGWQTAVPATVVMRRVRSN